MYRIQIKRSRRLFRNVWLVKKRTNSQKRLHRKIQRNPPRGNQRTSEFFLKLRARQYISQFYGHINWKAINRRIQGAPRLGTFFNSLETRLDVVLYRMKISPNLSVIKQLINHRKVLVNDQVVNVRNFSIKPGDIISVHPKAAIVLQKLYFKREPRFAGRGFARGGDSPSRFAGRGFARKGNPRFAERSFAPHAHGNLRTPLRSTSSGGWLRSSRALRARVGLKRAKRLALATSYWGGQKVIRFCSHKKQKAPHLEVNFKTMSAVVCTKPRFVRLPYVDDYKRLPSFSS